jgi:hypothetical protein
MIGKLSIKDSKVFKTKERAPILITAECFRLEEWCFDKKLNNNFTDNEEINIIDVEKINLNGNLLGKKKSFNNNTFNKSNIFNISYSFQINIYIIMYNKDNKWKCSNLLYYIFTNMV